ncbi:MAG: DEAD/DEAH box helicase family protein [Endomicrobium sp.]|jgi:type I restriction enzyme R subunit|nr:DEAD/DEAH box helicase family protein [Endomicrobium sp.]
MNEAETRAELIDPQLKESKWTSENNCKIFREFKITRPRVGQHNAVGKKADYVLSYNNFKLAVVEAKKAGLNVNEGVEQAKDYAKKLDVPYAIASNGKDIYLINMRTGKEQSLSTFPTPNELVDNLDNTFDWHNKLLAQFNYIDFKMSTDKKIRYYQETAVNKVMQAVAEDKKRILLTLATGTGKTFIASQISWKLFESRWNINKDGKRRPRILFLTDRNILADQAFNSFSFFPEDSLVRIRPDEISKKGGVPVNGNIFFAIFQTFMSGQDKPYFKQYPSDYFDFVIIDECHRGGADDQSVWRSILEYFSSAVQLGLTATPRREDNVDTYKYFGAPVYMYSLKDGINDGYLTPFKVRKFQTTLDTYIYSPDDDVLEGEVKEGYEYKEKDFNRIIEIEEREKKRVELFMNEINQNEKTIVFCANQEHAAKIRDLINQLEKASADTFYCVRVTSADGSIGEEHLRNFQDNEKSMPVVCTTSRKLSTGVDVCNLRNIVLMRPVKSMIEFKQIIGRGTRLFDGKNYFTIYDFVNAYKNFLDKKWDGEPVEIIENADKQKSYAEIKNTADNICLNEALAQYNDKDKNDALHQRKVKIRLADGKERYIKSMDSSYFFDTKGNFISPQRFLENLYGVLPPLFKDENELRKIWRSPDTRESLLVSLQEAGYDEEKLNFISELVDAQGSDIFDVLNYIAFAVPPVTRKERAANAVNKISSSLDLNCEQKEFLHFIIDRYVEAGTKELAEDKLPDLMVMKYNAVNDGIQKLSRDANAEEIRNMFKLSQFYLY